MDTGQIGRILVIGGLVLVAVGAVFVVAGGLGLGRLPGDLSFGQGRTRIYVPLATCLIISVVASIVLSLLSRR